MIESAIPSLIEIFSLSLITAVQGNAARKVVDLEPIRSLGTPGLFKKYILHLEPLGRLGLVDVERGAPDNAVAVVGHTAVWQRAT